MIRMVQSKSTGHAKDYFSDALLKSDYYLDDQELQGKMLGKLAERLNIEGAVTKDNFFALCENRNPLTGKPLTPRTKDARTVGYDINFHVPKSVSIVHALSDDPDILEAFQSSICETMQDIEADSKTRVRRNGKYEDAPTGELVWSEFVHQTARPVDGNLPDPHLHAHLFCFNATYDKNENRIKAGQFRDIKRDMPFYQSLFHKKMSDKLIALGYRVRRTAKSFEIEGVPQSVIDLFSKRTNEIGEIAKQKGITDARQLDKLGAMTRAKKQKGLTMAELKKEWQRQISEQAPSSKKENDAPLRHATQKKKQKLDEREVIDHTLKHAFERASVVPERRLLATAITQSIGHDELTTDRIFTAFKNDNRIINVKEKYQDFCTTKEVLAEERKMVALAQKSFGRLRPLYAEAPPLSVTGQLAEAATEVLTTGNQISIVRGAAGAGKTTMLKEVVNLMNKAGKQVTLVAQSADASRGVLVGEGFKDAETVATLLLNKEMQDKLQGQVLIVDEAGTLATDDMIKLLELAEKKNARLLLVGDTRQHSSVKRGDALRILNSVGGIQTAEVSRIRRQKNQDYRLAVEDLSVGNVKGAFYRLDAMDCIRTVDPMNPNAEIVSDYMEAVKKKKTVLIVSPTHQQGKKVTGELRQKLRAAGKLGKKEINVTKLENLNLTEAQKTDPKNFAKGQAVQFNQNLPKIKRGSVWTVDDVEDNKITIKDRDGNRNILPTQKPGFYNVYAKSELPLSIGDKVKITHGSPTKNGKRLDNGTALEVTSLTKDGTVLLFNRASKTTYEIDKDFGHIDHAYCSTSHAAQGKTVDRVLVSQPAATFGATDAKQFYVSVSRGRESVTVYTDDAEALLEHASRVGDRQSAMELVKKKPQAEYMEKQERENYYKNTMQSNKDELVKKQKQPTYGPRI